MGAISEKCNCGIVLQILTRLPGIETLLPSCRAKNAYSKAWHLELLTSGREIPMKHELQFGSICHADCYTFGPNLSLQYSGAFPGLSEFQKLS